MLTYVVITTVEAYCVIEICERRMKLNSLYGRESLVTQERPTKEIETSNGLHISMEFA
jgi:hypothetical protein